MQKVSVCTVCLLDKVVGSRAELSWAKQSDETLATQLFALSLTRQQLGLSYFHTLQAYQLLSCKSPLKHWDHLLKPNRERDWKHREEGQGEGMPVHLPFLRPECSYLHPAPSFTFSTEFLTLGVFPCNCHSRIHRNGKTDMIWNFACILCLWLHYLY